MTSVLFFYIISSACLVSCIFWLLTFISKNFYINKYFNYKYSFYKFIVFIIFIFCYLSFTNSIGCVGRFEKVNLQTLLVELKQNLYSIGYTNNTPSFNFNNSIPLSPITNDIISEISNIQLMLDVVAKHYDISKSCLLEDLWIQLNEELSKPELDIEKVKKILYRLHDVLFLPYTVCKNYF